jgi:hypothetical protein
MSTADLLRFWPTHSEVAACIKTEAEASSEAISLAVHQPMRFDRRTIGGPLAGSLDICDEQDLLNAFLAQDLPEGRVILPIVGSSGVGKSHVVRWLETQLRRFPSADRQVVIRIPKGTSLRGVLGLLLDRLHDPAYDDYRRELTRAQQELDPDEAAGLLCERLAQVLQAMHEQARERCLESPGDVDAQQRATYCNSDMLPTLFRNQSLRDQHFVRTTDGKHGVIRRLVEQLTENVQPGSDDERHHLFVAEDLRFDSRIDFAAIGRTAARAISAIDRDDRRPGVARILNEALDDAKEHLLHLDPTVSDLFDAIRRELLKDRKELVLLVEDFAVLSGLQKQLLQVVIKEAVRDGRQVLCTMRTALAYTTGYPVPETVLTRANIEYRIPNEPGSEDEILDRIERLVGAYLNAARLGRAALERAHASGASAFGDPRAWIPRFERNVEPEERATLEAFGSCSGGHELFPFNRGAIYQLAREGCMQDGRLVYNPRFVIQNIIRTVLVLRELFEQGTFPPAVFGSHTVAAPIVQEVTRRIPPARRDRYLRLLAYWGGTLRSTDDLARLPSQLFSAFGLDKMPFAGAAAPPPELPPRKPHSPTGPSPGPPIDSIETKWEGILEQWRRGRPLLQAEANQLRRWMVEALKGAIEWDWELFCPRTGGGVEAWHQFVFIPNAPGNEGRTAETAMVAVSSEEELQNEVESARVQSALMALVRFHAVHKDWDYDGATQDLPRYAALVEAAVPLARAFVRARYFRTAWDPIPALVQGLLIGARGLGLDGADKEQEPALINALFLSGPTDIQAAGGPMPAAEADPTGWERFTRALAACRQSLRPEPHEPWIAHLLELVGARQGGAERVHAVDVLQLKPLIEATAQEWQFRAQFPRNDPVGVPEFGPLKRIYGELVRSAAAVAEERLWLHAWCERTKNWLGDDTNKDEVVRTLKETVEAARSAGVARHTDTRALLHLIEAFRLSKVKATLEEAVGLDSTASRGKVLAVLGHGHAPVARLTDHLQAQFAEFALAVEADIAGEGTRMGADPIAEAVAELREELDETERLLRETRA